MPEDVLFEVETDESRETIASYLREVADNLEQGNAITLRSGSQSLSVEPAAHPTFEVKVEREGPEDGPGEMSIEFELEWDEQGDTASSENDDLQIE